jgi:hypothetical protein
MQKDRIIIVAIWNGKVSHALVHVLNFVKKDNTLVEI